MMGLGTRQPDGGKVVKLRKQLEMKQEDLAERAHISVRHVREIERANKSVPGTTITAIATVLKVHPDEITLSLSKETIPDENDSSRLKLRAVRSASELARLAFADRYIWDLCVDPTAATARELQQLLYIVCRVVERGNVTDEFDTDNVTGEYAVHPDNGIDHKTSSAPGIARRAPGRRGGRTRRLLLRPDRAWTPPHPLYPFRSERRPGKSH